MKASFSVRRLLPAVLGAALLLGGCGSDTWFGDAEDPPLPGERVSVLKLDAALEPDPALADTPVGVPDALANELWPQAGGYPDHVMGNLALPENLSRAWSIDAGSGSDSTLRLLAQPIVVDGRIYTLDADYNLTSFNAQNGNSNWRVSVAPPEESGEAIGGGIAFAEGKLIIATGYAEVLAIDPANGGMIWRRSVAGPVRGAPTVVSGRVFIVTVDNQLVALSIEDGASQWTHVGIQETAGLLGGSSPAVANNIVIAPYSSGEIYALRAENGRVAWSDALAAIRRVGELSGLADIRGLPVIDRGLVVAVSHSGRTAAIDARTGARVWDVDAGGIHTPWAAGDMYYVLTNDNQVIALMRSGGRVRWTAQLDRWSDPEDKTGAILWAGPVMGGGLLWLTGSTGELIALNPQDGHVVKRLDLPGSASLPPVIAGRTLYVLTDGADLVAYR